MRRLSESKKLIEFYYDSFFTLPNNGIEHFFKMNLVTNGKLVIPHSLFQFDHFSEERIYHQLFNPNWRSLTTFKSFMRKVHRYAKMSFYEPPWENTGFWVTDHNGQNSFGIGIDSLEMAIRALQDGRFYCCLANQDSTIVISSAFRSVSLRDTSLDVYVTNCRLPYVEMVQPFRDALDSLGKFGILADDFVETAIRKRSYENKIYLSKPYALVKGSLGVPVMAIAGNPFFSRKDVQISSLELFLMQMAGGFRNDDFDGIRPFSAELEEWILRDIVIADLLLK